MEELRPEQLHLSCSCSKFSFVTSQEIPLLINTVGQDRAIKAIETGLRTKADGFNIFITGTTGTGRNSTIKTLLTQLSKTKPVPPDWIYVYNFSEPNRPNAISFKAGEGSKFRHEMVEFIAIMKEKILKSFDSEHYDLEKNKIIDQIAEKSKMISDEVNKKANELGFQVNSSPEGVFTVPEKDGKALTPEEYQALTEEQRAEIEKKQITLQAEINLAIKKGQTLDKQLREQIKELDKRIGLFAVEVLIDELKQKYTHNSDVLVFLDDLKNDITSNIGLFKEDPRQRDSKNLDLFLDRYKINLIVDNSEQSGAPVIFEMNPSFHNLFGSIEYKQEGGYWITDLGYIRAGSLLRANGGYLILQIADVFTSPFIWDALKRTIKSKKNTIENLDEQLKVIPTVTLKPEPIPIDLKFILIGSSEIYSTLYVYDEDFRKYFKIRSQFDVEMDRTDETEQLYASFVATYCRSNNPEMGFDGPAISKIIEYGSRIMEDRNKLTTQFTLIGDLVNESIYWAELENRKIVLVEDVVKTLREKRYRSNLIEEKMHEMILNQMIRIDVKDKVMGQINGLYVMSNGEYSFGSPTRITATSAIGKGNVINIERESGMSGPIFNKGVMILSAYLSKQYANDRPFPVSVNLCFEQSYNGIEGDSASAAELLVILSSIADVPLRQELAITGSIDQQGNIQPIGGVNYKIEGFFDICVRKGLTGTQGVVIPWQNVQNLMLRDDVVEAVGDNKFHIYSARSITEIMELFSGISANDFNNKVVEKLDKFIQIANDFNAKSDKK
jgi:lon-related putative ATP-dependent protease